MIPYVAAAEIVLRSQHLLIVRNYRLVDELQTIDGQHEETHVKVDLAQDLLLLLFGIGLIVRVEDFQRIVTILDVVSETI
jgi:hypothetical protein